MRAPQDDAAAAEEEGFAYEDDEEAYRAAVRLQAAERGRKARSRVRSMRAPADDEGAEEEEVEAFAYAADDKGVHRAAVRLQAAERGRVARKEANVKREHHRAATKIQAAQRGKTARQQMAQKRAEVGRGTLSPHQQYLFRLLTSSVPTVLEKSSKTFPPSALTLRWGVYLRCTHTTPSMGRR